MTPRTEEHFRRKFVDELRLYTEPLPRSRNYGFQEIVDGDIFSLIEVRRSSEMFWRDDARFFLASNVRTMILEPISYDQSPIYPDADLSKLVADDVRLIIAASEKVARSRDKSHVSSTSVAIALGKTVGNLTSSKLQLWGD